MQRKGTDWQRSFRLLALPGSQARHDDDGCAGRRRNGGSPGSRPLLRATIGIAEGDQRS
jgi:hypothetical protein